MNAREAEEMADAMLRNSPLPDAGRSDERLDLAALKNGRWA